MQAAKSAKPATDAAVNGLPSKRSGKIIDDANIRNIVSQVAASRRHSIPESADEYPSVVTVLAERWRVIECSDGIQWIVQYRASAKTYATSRWVGRSWCTTREALMRRCIRFCGSARGLDRLPERFSAARR
jgi:hypothetical protein